MPAQSSETQLGRGNRASKESRKSNESIRGKNGGTEEGRDKLADAAKEQAIRLLARRDHSRLELQRKLALRGYPTDVVESIIARLADQDLQSDQRFAENFVRSTLNRGQGERKIRAGLQSHGIDDGSIAALLDIDDEQWLRLAAKAAQRRFGESPPEGDIELVKRGRFLINRGFPRGLALRACADSSASARYLSGIAED